ncbi:hypothetical protein LCGC14_2080820 [marine sediment metagenome]|uniref:Uncharacterized protein n=1 Tax=marine sediment metagenome TaxID=412755 RepID=A0A0F9EFY1_9ZZZZ
MKKSTINIANEGTIILAKSIITKIDYQIEKRFAYVFIRLTYDDATKLKTMLNESIHPPNK